MSEHEPRARYCTEIVGIPVSELRDDLTCPACDEGIQLMMLDPDCRDGKHQACTRMAWNEEKDEPANCECACHDMDDLTLMQLH